VTDATPQKCTTSQHGGQPVALGGVTPLRRSVGDRAPPAGTAPEQDEKPGKTALDASAVADTPVIHGETGNYYNLVNGFALNQIRRS
jgi:hypothetical protein